MLLALPLLVLLLIFGGMYFSGETTYDKDGDEMMGRGNFNVPNRGMMMGGGRGEIFSQSTENLPEVKKSEIVELKDGDVYEMEAYAVKQEVGNRTVRRLSYNGMIPGPILKVQKGAKITLRFKNSLDVPTTLHSHGLRLDDSHYDGLPTTMGGQQKPMQPGEVFEYELNFPDAGVY